MDETVFVADGPLYGVKCLLSTWSDHIVAGHSIMKGNEEAVKNVLEQPKIVYQSYNSPTRDVYFGQSPHSTYSPDLYTKVIVERPSSEEECGEVVTAFPSRTIGGNINKEVIRYDADQSRQQT